MSENVELNLLQDTVKLYLDLTGTTTQLCIYLLKVLDFLSDTDNADNKTEMIDLSNRILINIGTALVEHTDDERLKTITTWLNNRPNTILKIVPAQQFQDTLVLLTEITRVKEHLNVGYKHPSSHNN